ncbi:hypothetical protein NST11_16505 [Caldifermentibacillus hisashii]|uniref:hypothetical protein n=1 Tax=Caldifermentibacillus hisashii TaxID=996558 RepID=UPI0031B7E6AF
MLNYTLGKGEFEKWIISETAFSPDKLGKCESIMYLGNGYMGLRSATEEPYLKEVRNLFVNGTFNKFNIQFTMQWQGQPVTIYANHEKLIVKAERQEKFFFDVFGEEYVCTDVVDIPLQP